MPLVCPNDASPLRAVVGPPEWAPLVCDTCARGWWPTEVTAGSDGWDGTRKSFTPAVLAEIRPAVVAEADAAVDRGTSIDEGLLGELDAEQLAEVAARVDDAAFLDAVAAAEAALADVPVLPEPNLGPLVRSRKRRGKRG